jgi:nicotinamidase-related amidase
MKRALLVIDVQNEYFPGGALPIIHPQNHLENILETMDAAKRDEVTTIVVRHHQPDPNSPLFCKGSKNWELHPEVASRHHDLLLDKQLPGSFTNTGLEMFLRERGIDTVSIAGYMTQICCDTTAREAMHRGFTVEFLSDATGTLDVENSAGSVKADDLHKAILVAQQMFISEVISKDEFIDRIKFP